MAIEKDKISIFIVVICYFDEGNLQVIDRCVV